MSLSQCILQAVCRENNCVWPCLIKIAVLFVERASNCTKILCPGSVSKYFCMARFLLMTSLIGFHVRHLDYPSDSQQWRTQHVCLFWDWLLLESNHGSPLTSNLFRFRRDKYTRWNLLVTVRCHAMQYWLYFLSVLGLLEGTGISENSSGSRNIETFSSVFHLSPELDIHLPMGQYGARANSFFISSDQYPVSSDTFFLHSSIIWS